MRTQKKGSIPRSTCEFNFSIQAYDCRKSHSLTEYWFGHLSSSQSATHERPYLFFLRTVIVWELFFRDNQGENTLTKENNISDYKRFARRKIPPSETCSKIFKTGNPTDEGLIITQRSTWALPHWNRCTTYCISVHCATAYSTQKIPKSKLQVTGYWKWLKYIHIVGRWLQ